MLVHASLTDISTVARAARYIFGKLFSVSEAAASTIFLASATLLCKLAASTWAKLHFKTEISAWKQNSIQGLHLTQTPCAKKPLAWSLVLINGFGQKASRDSKNSTSKTTRQFNGFY
eukprot:1475901-Amphidinium_carterae.1